MAKAQLSLEDGDYSRAERLLLQAYEAGVGIFGAHHGAVGLVLLRLASVCQRTGRSELGARYEAEADDILASYVLEH
ncbi:MAG TPA: hypothetical protein V6D22_11890 [Candidatus Obscuribacterales bacterium]